MYQPANILIPETHATKSEQTVPSFSFIEFVVGTPVNKRYLAWATGLIVVQFITFKIMYPYADFFSDSYSYLFAASENLSVSIWPIGYSKFLLFFHKITHSDTALVCFQYLLFELSAIYFFYTILYFYKPAKTSQFIIFILLFLNPLSLYLCNTINSDALFAGLSVIWFTQLIWIIQRPSFPQLVIHGILLFLCFTVRNNAYYYPVISLLAFMVSKQRLWYKLIGVLLPVLLITAFIIKTKNAAFNLTGTRQFSLFTGWQLANNALYFYNEVNVDSAQFSTPASRELNRISREYFKHIKRDSYRQNLESYVGNFFIRQPEAPLKQFFFNHYQPKGEIELIRDWGRASAEFEPFGKTIILHNPLGYARYFIMPNIWHYFLPPLSHLEIYNYGKNKVDNIAREWFDFKTNRITCISNEFQGTVLLAYPAIFLMSNLYFAWAVLLVIKRKITKGGIFKLPGILGLVCSFLIVNFIFSISTTLNILRYQFFPMIVCLSFALIFMDWLNNEAPHGSKAEINQIKKLKN